MVANISAVAMQDEKAYWQKAFDMEMMHKVNAATPFLERSKRSAVVAVSCASVVKVISPASQWRFQSLASNLRIRNGG